MNNSIKTKWLEALRSGKYKQGRFQLKHTGIFSEGGEYPERYCCLGVLCDIISRGKDTPIEVIDVARNDLKNRSIPHSLIFQYADLEEHDHGGWVPEVECRDGSTRTLDNINDAGYTFREIADLIERQI